MKKYILTRLIKSIFSIFIVTSIVIVMVYTMIPTSVAFQGDSGFQKLSGNAKIDYMYNKLSELGYLDYVNLNDMCKDSDDVAACMTLGSSENIAVVDSYRDKGYTVETFANENNVEGQDYAYRYYNPIELLFRFYSNFLVIDTPFAVQDAGNPDLSRSYSLGTTPTGGPALLCSGCTSKYQIYLSTSFPFVHQNIVSLNFGKSFPTNQGIDTLEVITAGQGTFVPVEQTFPTGVTQTSPIDQVSCKYKPTVDNLDKAKFTDNYADCDLYYESPSMVETSYIFGGFSVILGYLVALPFGIMMARKKGKWFDKFGMVYINLLIALPSLAFIFIMKYFGSFFSLPDKFPQYGFNDIRSYILPIIILGLLNTPNIMTWLRRYMVDQANADYVKFAKAKGLTEKEIYQDHILKNAIIPIINGIPAAIILAISGAVITETVFAIPGMGKMLPDAIKAANNNMVITLTFIFTALAIFSVFIGDILMTLVDPRIKLTKKEND